MRVATGNSYLHGVVAYAFKLIGSITRADLDLIKFLRNEFAHSRLPFDFKTPEVRAVCDQLKIVEVPGITIPHGYISRDFWKIRGS
jgi:hypothetical protein